MQTWTVSYTPKHLTPLGLPRAFPKPQQTEIAAGTLVATSRGWRAVDTLAAGDQIWTFDGGLQTLLGVRRRQMRSNTEQNTPADPLVCIPAYALGNERDIICAATAGLLLECENASDPMGEPYAVIPASALVGICDVAEYKAKEPVTLYTLQFRKEQAVYCDSGLPFHFAGMNRPKTPQYDVKSHDAARALMTDADVDALALREPYEEFFTDVHAERA